MRLLHKCNSSMLGKLASVGGTVTRRFSPKFTKTRPAHRPSSSGSLVSLFPLALKTCMVRSLPICFGNDASLLLEQFNSRKCIKSPSSGGNSVTALKDTSKTSNSRPMVHTTSSTRVQPR